MKFVLSMGIIFFPKRESWWAEKIFLDNNDNVDRFKMLKLFQQLFDLCLT